MRKRFQVLTPSRAVTYRIDLLSHFRVRLVPDDAPAVRACKVRLILRAYEPDGLPVHLVHAGQGTLPFKTRSFLDFAVARLRSALAALPAADAVSPS
jgi:hypothetical protein